MFYIYTITNSINYKVYVGQTTVPKKRWASHKCEAKSDRAYLPIHRAIKKYGEKNFQFDLISAYQSQQEVDDTEVYWISFFDSQNNKSGYNLAVGGNSNSGWHHTEESKRKISESNMGKKMPPHTDDWRENMSIAMTGRKIKWSQKISEAQSKVGVETENNILKEYDNGATAISLGEKYGCSKRTIFNIVKRRRKYEM